MSNTNPSIKTGSELAKEKLFRPVIGHPPYVRRVTQNYMQTNTNSINKTRATQQETRGQNASKSF